MKPIEKKPVGNRRRCFDKMLQARMEPGVRYTAAQLARIAGLPEDAVAGALKQAVFDGLCRTATNRSFQTFFWITDFTLRPLPKEPGQSPKIHDANTGPAPDCSIPSATFSRTLLRWPLTNGARCS